MEIIFNELVIDDPDVMKLDHPEKLKFLFKCIIETQYAMAIEYPEEQHIVFVRLYDE
jgi:hypothetical protein